MPRRVVAVLAAVLVTLLAAPAVGTAAPEPSAGAAVVSTPPTAPPGTDNPFVPDRNLSDCVSAVPQPNCGSEARGGWRQTLVFGVVVVALAFFGWRITRAVRRNRKLLEPDGR